MNLIIQDVQGMAEVRLHLCVHTLRHFPPQFTFTEDLQRGDRIAVFIGRRIQSFGLRYEFARIIHLSFENWLPRLSISMYLTFINKSTVHQLLVRKTLSAPRLLSTKRTPTCFVCRQPDLQRAIIYFDINIYFGTHVVSTLFVFGNPWFMNSRVNHRVIIIF